MDNKRKALGQGLEQLFTNEILDFAEIEDTILKTTKKADILELNLNEIKSNPYQPRKHFDEASLEEMASSIKEHGIIQPIIVRKDIKGYQIVAGERRVKASIKAGLITIPAIVKDFSDEIMMQISLLENLQREDLNAIEEAYAYKNLLEKLNITQEELSVRMGKSRSHITNIIGLLRLPENVKNMVIDKKISMAHARVLSKLESDEEIENIAKYITNNNISVRKLEEMATEWTLNKKNPMKKRESKNEYSYIEEYMKEKLGTKVKISDQKIEIFFDNNNDLMRILDVIKINLN